MCSYVLDCQYVSIDGDLWCRFVQIYVYVCRDGWTARSSFVKQWCFMVSIEPTECKHSFRFVYTPIIYIYCTDLPFYCKPCQWCNGTLRILRK